MRVSLNPLKASTLLPVRVVISPDGENTFDTERRFENAAALAKRREQESLESNITVRHEEPPRVDLPTVQDYLNALETAEPLEPLDPEWDDVEFLAANGEFVVGEVETAEAAA